jgi:hypothetical protein
MSSRDQELITVAGRHTEDTVADLSLTGFPLTGLPGGVDRADQAADGVDLSADPFHDNLADELAARQPVRLTSRTTLALGGVLLIIGGFVGGVLMQKNFGTASTSGVAAVAAAGANGRGGFGGAGGPGGPGGPGGAGQATPGQAGAGTGNATTGTVKLVDGTTVYVTTANGQVITVKTSSSTAVTVAQSGALKDLAAGATVTVQGTAGADGVITATQVTSQK